MTVCPVWGKRRRFRAADWGVVLIVALCYNGGHLREVTEVKISGAVAREGDFPPQGYAQ